MKIFSKAGKQLAELLYDPSLGKVTHFGLDASADRFQLTASSRGALTRCTYSVPALLASH